NFATFLRLSLLDQLFCVLIWTLVAVVIAILFWKLIPKQLRCYLLAGALGMIPAATILAFQTELSGVPLFGTIINAVDPLRLTFAFRLFTIMLLASTVST